jgi:hypothetical protein
MNRVWVLLEAILQRRTQVVIFLPLTVLLFFLPLASLVNEGQYCNNNQGSTHDYDDNQPSPRILLNTCFGVLMQSETNFLGFKIVYGIVRPQEDVSENVRVQ